MGYQFSIKIGVFVLITGQLELWQKKTNVQTSDTLPPMIFFRVSFQGLEQMFGLILMTFGWVLMDVKKFKFMIATPSEQGDKVIHQKGLHEQEFSPYLHESGADKKNGCFLLLSYKQIEHTGKTNKDISPDFA
jgi:hypothetical protein